MIARFRFRPHAGGAADPLAGRLLVAYLVSLLLHAVILFGVTGGWLSKPRSLDKSPVYYVDLVHKPVLNPQPGRPEPRTVEERPRPVPAAPAPQPQVKTARPAKPSVPAKSGTVADDNHVTDALEKLRNEQELQQRLAALRKTHAVPAEVPVGLPGARGDEAGVFALDHVQATIQQNWALSPYLLADEKKMARIEAWVRLSYTRSGRLERFRFERHSGDPQFDESIKRALAKSQQLAQPLPERLEDVLVVFNLKALAENRR